MIGPFCKKYITFGLKKYRGVIFHDTEESCKVWKKIDLWFGKWHEEFSKFSSEHLKVSKLVLSWDPLSKVENAWASTYRGVMCNDTEEWWKIWRGIDLLFQNWHKEFDEFWFENLKVSKIYTLTRCFWPKYIMFELTSTQEVCLIVLNIDAKFEGKLTRAFKNDMRNLANCQQSMFESLNTGTFIGYFYTK